MDCISPGEVFASRGQLREPPRGSRVINVVSREESSPPESPPFAKSWAALSSRQHAAKVLGQPSRSRSMTDVLAGQRKSPGLYHRWKGESRVLPSCRANPNRRSPGSGRNSRSTTPDLLRKDSDSTISRHSLDLERSQSANEVTSVKTRKRNKSDSGIVLDEYLPRASLSSGSQSLKLGLSHLDNPVRSLRRDQSISDAKSLSELDSAEEGNRPYGFSDTAGATFDTSRDRRQRNYSESELTASFSPSVDADDSFLSLSGKPKHPPQHRSLESLTQKDNGNIFPDFLPSSLGAPEMNLGSQEWGPALQGIPRTDSMEHLNSTSSRLGPGSVDDDDDQLNVSWSSSGWRKSVRARSSCSSEDSAEDVFVSTGDSLGEVPEAFQKYLRSTMLDSESDSEPVVPRNQQQGTAASTRRAEQLKCSAEDQCLTSDSHGRHRSTSSGRSGTKPSLGVTSDGARSKADSSQRNVKDNEIVRKDNSQRSKVATRMQQTTKAHVEEDQSLVKSAASDDHPDVYKTSRSASMLLPHLQKTLEAVRQHIKSKKSSPSSKIPVLTRQQISPRRHRSQSGMSGGRSRGNSSESSANGAPSDLVPSIGPVSRDAGIVPRSHASSNQANSPSRKESVVDSRRHSQVLVPTAVSVTPAQDLSNSSRIGTKGKDNGGWTANLLSSARGSGDELSVFSPRPPRVQVQGSDTPSTDDGDQWDSSRVKVNSLSCTNSDASQSKAGPSPKKVEPSPKRLELSPGKREVSPRKTESSPRNEDVSPRSRSGENSPRKYKRKASSRVEYLLNNDLFKKHLSGHIDLVEKNILHIKKFGLKKSFSNLDLTVTDSAKLRAAFESSLRLQDADPNSSFKDESEKNENDRKLPKREGLDSAPSCPSTAHRQSVEDAATDPSQTPRRKSLACDDPSLHHLREVLRQGQPFPATVFTATRRGRMQIPSFHEFRKQHQRVGEDSGKVSHTSADGTHPSEDSGDGLGGLAMNYRPLDTITEDDGADTARSSVLVSSESSARRERVEDSGEGVEKHRAKEAVSEESSTLPGSIHGDGESAMNKDTSQQSANRRDAKEGSSHLKAEEAKVKKSSKPIPKMSKAVENKPSTDPKAERQFTSKLASLRNNQRVQKITTAAENIPKTRTSRETSYEKELPQEVSEMEGNDYELVTNHSSSSSDATVHGDISDGEIMLEDENGDDNMATRAFEEDFPYPLFDEHANSMDTESWARLFTKVRRFII